MSYRYNPYTDTYIHDDDEGITVALPVPTNGTSLPEKTSLIVEKHELTDECIERIAEAVVRKLIEVEHNGIQ